MALCNPLFGSASSASDPFRRTSGGRNSTLLPGDAASPDDDELRAKYHINEVWNKDQINAAALKVIAEGKTMVLTGQSYLRSAAGHEAKSSYILGEAQLAVADSENGEAKVDEGNRQIAEGQRVLQLLTEEEQRLAAELKSPLNQFWKGTNGNLANGVILAADGYTVKFMSPNGRISNLPLDRFDSQYLGLFQSTLLQSWLSNTTHPSQEAALVTKIDHAPTIPADQISSTWGTVASLAADYDATPVSVAFGLLRAFEYDQVREFFLYEVDIVGFGQAVLRSKSALPQEKMYNLPLAYVGTSPFVTVGGASKLVGVFELAQTSSRGAREQLVEKMQPLLDSLLHFLRSNPDHRAELYAGFFNVEHRTNASSSYTFNGSQLWNDTRDFFQADVIAHNTTNFDLWTKAEALPVKTVDVGKLSF